MKQLTISSGSYTFPLTEQQTLGQSSLAVSPGLVTDPSYFKKIPAEQILSYLTSVSTSLSSAVVSTPLVSDLPYFKVLSTPQVLSNISSVGSSISSKAGFLDYRSGKTDVETHASSEGNKGPVVWLPTPRAAQDKFISLQQWEGTVLSVLDDSFIARLVDSDESEPDEEAEILISEISPDDYDLIQPGAIFYWNIGYLDQKTGQRVRASLIRFRRLPVWADEEIQGAKLEAEIIEKGISWD